MDVEAPMAGEPSLDPRMLVSRVIVDDQMDLEISRNTVVEMVEKSEKLLVPMARFALSDDRTVEHVERRKQGGGAVPIIVVGYPFDIAEAHRQHRLGARQRLDLRLFIHAQHERLVGRIEIEPHYVTHLLDKERVGGKLEALGTMRLEPEQCEVARYRALGDAGLHRHPAHAPVGGVV